MQCEDRSCIKSSDGEALTHFPVAVFSTAVLNQCIQIFLKIALRTYFRDSLFQRMFWINGFTTYWYGITFGV